MIGCDSSPNGAPFFFAFMVPLGSNGPTLRPRLQGFNGLRQIRGVCGKGEPAEISNGVTSLEGECHQGIQLYNW